MNIQQEGIPFGQIKIILLVKYIQISIPSPKNQKVRYQREQIVLIYKNWIFVTQKMKKQNICLPNQFMISDKKIQLKKKLRAKNKKRVVKEQDISLKDNDEIEVIYGLKGGGN